MRTSFLPLVASLLVACSGASETIDPITEADANADGATVVDTSASPDTATTVDSGTPIDTGTTTDGTSTPDTSTTDTATATDVLIGDASICHALPFEKDAVTITKVATLPTMTGGVIPLGFYDATGAQTTGSITGTYRAMWRFTDATTLLSLEQLTITATPPPAVPRALSWSTSGINLTRTQACGGSATFTNQYTVRTTSTGTFLDVRQETVMFTFTKRP